MVRLNVLLTGVALLLLVPTLGVAGKGPPAKEFAAVVFVDFPAPSHAGPGPHPTEESDSFLLTEGGIRWFSGPDVRYRLAVPSGFEQAVLDAVAHVDTFITTRNFVRDDTSPSINPCTGQGNIIEFGPVDGKGGALAVAEVCRNVATKEIVGFRIVLDEAEDWATTGDPDKFDVQNVATHEMGHVAGLGHVNAPGDGCLTMYRLAGEGETQKRTFGLGDKLGTDELYGHGDTSPGPGCGA